MMVHIRKLVKPILFSFLIVLGYALLVRLTINPASATSQVDQTHASGASYGLSPNAQGQSFIPTKPNLSKIDLKYTCSGTGTTTVDMYLCEGTPGNIATFPTTYDCSASGNTLIKAELNFAISCGTGDKYAEWWPNIEINPNITHYWVLDPVGALNIGIKYSVGGYANGYYLGGGDTTGDAYFVTYYDDGFTPEDYSDVTIVDFNDTMGFDYQMISFNEDNFCMATSTETCSVPFRFNDYAVGSVVYAYLGTGGNATGTLLASTSIADNVTDTGYLEIPYVAEYVGEKKPMCAFLYDPDLEEASQMICNWNIDWLSQEEMNELLARSKISEYNIEEACDDMDDTASTTFLYGIECGFRKVVYWATKPSAETQMAFLTSASNLKSQFPMSVYYQVKDNMMRLPTEWATTSTSTLPSVPLMWAGQDTGADLLRADIISSSQMSDTWERFNDYLSYFIYMMTFLYFVSEIFAHADRQNKQE